MNTNGTTPQPQLTPVERQLVSRWRHMQRRHGRRPFTFVVVSGGGPSPVQFFAAQPIGRVDKGGGDAL